MAPTMNRVIHIASLCYYLMGMTVLAALSGVNCNVRSPLIDNGTCSQSTKSRHETEDNVLCVSYYAPGEEAYYMFGMGIEELIANENWLMSQDQIQFCDADLCIDCDAQYMVTNTPTRSPSSMAELECNSGQFFTGGNWSTCSPKRYREEPDPIIACGAIEYTPDLITITPLTQSKLEYYRVSLNR